MGDFAGFYDSVAVAGADNIRDGIPDIMYRGPRKLGIGGSLSFLLPVYGVFKSVSVVSIA